MRSPRLSLLAFVPFVFILLFSVPARASHMMGGDMTYKALGKDTFIIDLVIFRDCNGIQLTNGPLTVTPTCGGATSTFNVSFDAGQDVTPVCPSTVTRCQNSSSSFTFGIQKFEALTKVYLLGSCCVFDISWQQSARNGAITTGAAGQNYYTEIEINKCARPGNSSPSFTSLPPFLNLKQGCYTISPGMILNSTQAALADSFVFKRVEPLSDHGQTIPYSSGYSYETPLIYRGYPDTTWKPSSCSGFRFDPTTGVMQFRPTQEDITVLAYTVEQWEKDTSGKMTMLGRVRRDVQISITTEENRLPVLSGINNTSATELYCKAGKQTCFSMYTFDPDTADSIIVRTNNAIPAAHVGISKAKHPEISVCWKPDSSDARPTPYFLTVTAHDNACPIEGIISQTFKIHVLLGDVSDFDVPDTICISQALMPVNRSLYDTMPGFRWTFGDGDSSNKKSPEHFYTSAGRYKVMLVLDSSGKVLDSASKWITVVDAPMASFALVKKGVCAQNSVVYVYDSSKNIYGGTYTWDFGNGTTSHQRTDSIRYTKDSTYTIRLIVNGKYGCADTISKSVYIGAAKPYFEWKSDTVQCLKGNAFQVGKVTASGKRLWAFGDDSSSTADAPSHTYSAGGTYTVTLQVTDSMGCVASYSRQVSVNSISAAFAAGNKDICIGQQAVLRATGNPNTHEPIRYLWFMDNGDTLSGAIVFYTWTKPGRYHVRLVAWDSLHCTDSSGQDIYVHPLPVASIKGKDSVYMADTSLFTAPWLPGASYYWTGASGMHISASDSIAKLTFDTSGIWTLHLEVKDSIGCSDTASRRIIVLQGSGIQQPQLFSGVNIYPNPAGDVLTIALKTAKAGLIRVNVFDAFGKQQSTESIRLVPGNNTFSLKLDGLPAGTYFLQLLSDKDVSVKPFFKQ